MTLAQLRAELEQRRPQPEIVDYLLATYTVDPAGVEAYKQQRAELCPNWKPWNYAWFIHQGKQLVVSEEVEA